jgi:hypothetical protein
MWVFIPYNWDGTKPKEVRVFKQGDLVRIKSQPLHMAMSVVGREGFVEECREEPKGFKFRELGAGRFGCRRWVPLEHLEAYNTEELCRLKQEFDEERAENARKAAEHRRQIEEQWEELTKALAQRHQIKVEAVLDIYQELQQVPPGSSLKRGDEG